MELFWEVNDSNYVNCKIHTMAKVHSMMEKLNKLWVFYVLVNGNGYYYETKWKVVLFKPTKSLS